MIVQYQLISYVQRIGDATYFLALTYLLVALLGIRKLLVSRAASGRKWEPESIFLASILFACGVRFMSFTTISFLSFKNIHLTTDDDDPGAESHTVVTTEHEDFYRRGTVILFNIGDFVSLTAYLMLVVVWVETFQRTRRHFFSAAALKRKWMMVYLSLTAFLYFMLFLLYALFLASNERSPRFLDAIYVTLGLVNLFVPTALIFSWCCLTLIYSGFPFRSRNAKSRWKQVNRTVFLWSVGRIMWGLASIVSMYVNWSEKTTTWKFAIGLVTLVLVAEVLPFLLAPTSEVSPIFREDEAHEGSFIHSGVAPGISSPPGSQGGSLYAGSNLHSRRTSFASSTRMGAISDGEHPSAASVPASTMRPQSGHSTLAMDRRGELQGVS